MAKTLYHSALAGMGPVQVTVKSDVLQSKFKKDQRYVTLVISGEEKTYNCENDDCAAFFQGQRGRSFTLVAEGSREEAVLTYVGEGVADPAPAAPAKGMPRKATAKQPASKPPATPPAQRAAPPPAAAAPAQAARPPAAKPPSANSGQHWTPNGQTVGMAINQACEFCRAEAVAGLTPPAAGMFDGRRVTEIASRLLEIARWLERGNLLPKQVAPAGPATPEPVSDNDGGTN